LANSDDEPQQEGGDEVQRLRRESARRRLRVQEVEQQLAAAGTENERLNTLVGNLLRENVERLAADRIIDKNDLWRVTNLDEVLTADGTAVDPAKVKSVVDNMPAHWRNEQRHPHGNRFQSGASGRAPARAPSWAAALRPGDE
jgi:hypothetical protein